MQLTRKDRMLTKSLITTGIAALMGGSAFGQESDVEVRGYMRGYAGMTTERTIETDTGSGALNMLRGQVYLEAQNKKSAMQWKVSGRVVQESKTSYLNDLQTHNRTVPSLYSNPNFDVMDNYNKNEIRDAWVQVQPTENLNVKFGRQQVVWGETDLFQALDIIHGHNLTWAPLLEEADETRKPLVLLNTELSIPEADGSLQLILRPGWDPLSYNGSTWDLQGGRARPIGYKGASSDYLYDYAHPKGDLKNKLTYALRWKGMAAGLNYHMSYVKMPYVRNPIANTSLAPYEKTPIGTSPSGVVTNWIVPIVEVYGAGVNAYASSIDTVLTAEVVNTRDEPFNVGSAPGASAAACLGPMGMSPDLTSFSGLCGVKRKSTMMTMFKAEKSLKTNDILGTSSPMTAGLQVFNTWIKDFNAAEGLVQSIGYPNPVKKNSTFVSLVMRAPFMHDKLTPTIAFGRDITNQGSLRAIAVDYEAGTNWRLRAELDTFKGNSTVSMKPGTPVGNAPVGGASGMTGLLSGSSKFVMRATYQF